MKGEVVVLLVAGLTIAATLPTQEQLSTSTLTELLNIIRSANPEENDLQTNDKRLSVSPTKIESQAVLTDQSQPQPQHPRQEQPQEQPQHPPQEQPQHPPQEQSQPQEIHTQDTAPEEPQSQNSPQSREQDTPPDEDIVLTTNNEPFPLNIDGPVMYDPKTETLNEEDKFLFNPEEPEAEYSEYFPDDFNEWTLSFDSMSDSYPPHKEEDSFVDDSELLNIRPLMDSFPLGGEHTDSDYDQQQESYDIEPVYSNFNGILSEEKQPYYDYYEFPVEEDQSQYRDDILSIHDNDPNDESYPESDDSALEFIKWLVPDFLYKDHINYNDPSYATSYQDDAAADQESFLTKPDMDMESQTLMDQTTNSKEYNNEAFDEIINFDESFPENENAVMEEEAMEPTSYDLTDTPNDHVSLTDFYIPINDGPDYDDIPDKYYEDEPLQDEDIIPDEEENFSVDDGLHTNAPLRIYYGDMEKNKPYTKNLNDDILFDNPSFEDKMSAIQKTAEDDNEYEYKYMGGDTPTPPIIIETPPADVSYVDAKVKYPSLLKMIKEEIVGKQLIEPWNGAQSLLIKARINLDSEDDIKDQFMNNEYLSNHIDNDDSMNIIVLKDSKNMFDDDIDDIDNDQVPTDTRYTKDQNTLQPYWLNYIMDDDLPFRSFISPKTQTRFTYNDRDGLKSLRKTPKLSFRDMLKLLNPSFPDDPYVNSYPLYYPQSYDYLSGYGNFDSPSHRSPYSSSSYQSFDESSYLPVQTHYYNTKPRIMSSYSSIIEPSNLFQQDTMTQREYQEPMRYFDDNKANHEFRFKDSFNSPRVPFYFYPKLQHSSDYPSYRTPRYFQNNFYDMEPHTPPMHTRYPFHYY